MTRHQEDNLMGWLIIMMIALFVGATCKASQNIKHQETQESECQQ